MLVHNSGMRRKKKEKEAPAVTFPLCVGDMQNSRVQASWLQSGGNVISLPQHTSVHNPLPLFTLDQLQSSSTLHYLGLTHEAHLCTFFSLSLIPASFTVLLKRYPIHTDTHLFGHVFLCQFD